MAAPERSSADGAGASTAIVAVVAIVVLLILVWFLFFRGGGVVTNGTDIDADVDINTNGSALEEVDPGAAIDDITE